ncbi:hypothetical protein TNCV_1364691 [Trichonephila clavipes]|nr:hypothetical protein TNCV_1364691 [Trichonephila clavipes]
MLSLLNRQSYDLSLSDILGTQKDYMFYISSPPILQSQKDEAAKLNLFRTATASSDVVQSGRPIIDDFFQHLWPYIGKNTANVVFQMVKRLWLIRIDQRLYIAPQKIV